MEKGKTYRITYKQESNYRWYRWESTGVFMNEDADGQCYFSYRPFGGTGWLKRVDILSIEEADEIKLPRKLKGVYDPNNEVVRMAGRMSVKD